MCCQLGEVRHCSDCGEPLEEGEEAYAITSGELDYEKYRGFVADDLSPWEHVFHKKCWEVFITFTLQHC